MGLYLERLIFGVENKIKKCMGLLYKRKELVS